MRAAIDADIPVIPIPGASAALGALSAAGLPSDAFRFCGFLPPKSSQRRRVLEEWKTESGTLIFYETPHRILDALDDVTAVMGARPVAIARELTKIHEEFLRGTAAEIHATLAARPSVKGEIYSADRESAGQTSVGFGRSVTPGSEIVRCRKPCAPPSARVCLTWTRSSAWPAKEDSGNAKCTARWKENKFPPWSEMT